MIKNKNDKTKKDIPNRETKKALGEIDNMKNKDEYKRHSNFEEILKVVV